MTAAGASSLRDLVAGALRAWADRGWLRRLDAALAAFIADVSATADGTVLLAAALAAHLEGQGHACLVLASLLDDPANLLGWEADAIDALRHVLARLPADEAGWLAALAASDAVHVHGRTADSGGTPFVVDGGRFYLRRYWDYERRIAGAVASRAHVAMPLDVASTASSIDAVFGRAPEKRDVDWQRVAAALALRGSFTIVTGGPGTGKTWTAARFIALLLATAEEPSTLRIALAAPTGKAAARLRQSIDLAFSDLGEQVGERIPLAALASRIGPARTLHSLLGTRRGSRRFRHDATHPLAFDVVVVDEASMIDVELMAALVDALPPTSRLLLLGDKDQLSSVEAGAVLGELCGVADNRFDRETADYLVAATGADVPVDGRTAGDPATRVVALRRSERFGGAIGGLARAVNEGRTPDARALLGGRAGPTVAWSDAATPEAVVSLASTGFADYLAVLRERPDSLFGEDHDVWVRRVVEAFERFRLLCAVRVGAWGVVALNRAIEERLAHEGRIAAGVAWYEGRPVLVGRNDYDVGVFNGDIGIALPASRSDARLRVWFADGPSSLRAVAPTRLADVETAFAMTVHKSQGSEFAHTALVLPPTGSRVVTRELLYTGITRARERFTLIAPSPDTLGEAIARRTRRSSGIAAMLWGPQGAP